MGNKILRTFIALAAIIIAVPLCAYAAEGDELLGTASIVSDGTPQYGESILADTSGITNNTGTFAYQWLRNGSAIAGANAASYTLVQDDIGANVSVSITSTVETGIITSPAVSAGKADRVAPAAPTELSGDHYNVILNLAAGCEYKVSGGSYTSSNTFSGLKSNTEYKFYQRYMETATHNASPSSSSLSVTTDYILLTNTTYNISNLNSGDGVLVNGSVTLSGTQSIRVYCNAGASLTLQNASINVSTMSGECAVEFAGSGSLILSGTNSLQSGSGRAGVESNSTLSISGGGSLHAKGGTNAAGIGGGNGENAGTVSVSNGVITAAAGTNGAGIGGGNGGNGGNLVVSGGVIFAVGSIGDDIGGGNGGSQGGLNIAGGSAVFMKNNSAPSAGTSTHTLYSSQTVSDGRAYGYDLPSLWAEGSTAYAYIDYCTVSFDTNGAGVIASQTVGKAGRITEPTEPQKTGFVFGGWYTDSGFTDDFNVSSDRVYDDITLYAKWSIEVTISTNEGGSVTPSETVLLDIGEDLLIECTPNENFAVGAITSEKSHTIVDNEDNTYTIENIEQEDTIVIAFESTIMLGTVIINHDSTPQCREQVSVNTANVENTGIVLLYQWIRDGVNIAGANDAIYMLSTEDVGHFVGVKVTSAQKEGELIDTIAIKVSKAMKAAPRPPELLGKTTDTIKLVEVEGCEYKLEDGDWQDSTVFAGLEPETEYTFYQRYKVSGSHKASNQSFAFKVTTDGFSVEEIMFSIDGTRLHKGDVIDLEEIFKYSIYPQNAMNKNVTWISSNEKVAVIDSENGTVVAVGEGKTIITITAADNKNGVLSDTCILQVYNPAVVPDDAYLGELTGRFIDYQGKALSGYTITLYSNPVSNETNSKGEFQFKYIPYTNHVLIIEDENSQEIGRYILNWDLGEKEKASIDNETNVINITYTDATESINIPFETNKTLDNVKIRTFEGVNFIDAEGNETNSKKVYMLVLMGIIAACIIGVGYVLYIGRIQRKEYAEGSMDESGAEFYEQVLLEETALTKPEKPAEIESDTKKEALDENSETDAEQPAPKDEQKTAPEDEKKTESENEQKAEPEDEPAQEDEKVDLEQSSFQGHVELIDKNKKKK